MLPAPEPLDRPSLYVHVPFCVVQCPYCDFYSTGNDDRHEAAYLDALEAELDERGPLGSPPYEVVFVGGGTPTSLPVERLARLLAILGPWIATAPREWTVEANPESATPERLALLRAAGATRLSIGVQSMTPHGLAFLGRPHDVAGAIRALENARAAGFDRINLDLIYGYPGHGVDTWRGELDEAVAFGTEHVSAYCLTYEEGTPMGARRDRGEIVPIGQDAERRLLDLTVERLAGHGLARYEISNFARPGRECLQNLNYWTGGEYVGVGVAAHSHLDGRRTANERSLRRYLARDWQTFDERLAPEAKARETLMLHLRLTAGVDIASFRARTGHDPIAFLGPRIDEFLAAGLIATDGGRLRLTEDGLAVADDILCEVVAPAA